MMPSDITELLLNLELQNGAAKVREGCRRYLMRKTYAGEKKELRRQISVGKKQKLFGRQHGLCARCKKPMNFEEATVDHLVAAVRGGKSDSKNVRLCCRTCNSSKGVNTPSQEAKLTGETIFEQISPLLEADREEDLDNED